MYIKYFIFSKVEIFSGFFKRGVFRCRFGSPTPRDVLSQGG